MSLIRAQMAFQGDSGLPEDEYTNTFYVSTVDLDTVAEDLSSDLVRFYNTATTSGNKISDFLGPQLDGTYRLKLYDMADAEPRVPKWIFSGAGIDVAGEGLPSECAVTLSFHAPIVSGDIPARKKGRVFIGPLATGASDAGDTPRPAAALRTCFAEAATRLLAEWAADAIVWVVFSPTANAWEGVEGGWIDNAFDTIRSRGERATARTPWGSDAA